MLFYVKFLYFNISGNTITYCASNSVSPIANNQLITNINIKTDTIMTRNDINGLIYFCERKFGTTDIPFIMVVNSLQQEADIYHTNIEDILQYEYIRHEEMDKERQYLEQQEEDERDYVDNYQKWL